MKSGNNHLVKIISILIAAATEIGALVIAAVLLVRHHRKKPADTTEFPADETINDADAPDSGEAAEAGEKTEEDLPAE